MEELKARAWYRNIMACCFAIGTGLLFGSVFHWMEHLSNKVTYYEMLEHARKEDDDWCRFMLERQGNFLYKRIRRAEARNMESDSDESLDES